MMARRQETKDSDRQRQRARQRAYRRLVEMHPHDFAVLLAEEHEREGLPPVGSPQVMPHEYGVAS